MKTIRSLFAIACILGFTNLQAQTSYFQKSAGNNEDDELIQVEKTVGGYVYTGNHRIAGTSHIQTFKTDTAGTILWNRVFEGPVNDFAEDLIVTNTNFIITAGTTRYIFGSQNTSDGILIKQNQNGNVIWQKCYQVNNFETTISSIKQTSDGGFVFVGSYYDTFNYISYVCKTDSNGVVSWCKDYNGSITLTSNSIRELSNGDYLVTGNVAVGFQMIDAYVYRISATGAPIWENIVNYNLNWQNSELFYSAELPSGNLLLAGRSDVQGSGNMDFMACKLDANGNVLLNNFYGSSQIDWGYNAIYKNNEFYLCGNSQGYGNPTQGDALVLKLDSNLNYVNGLFIGDTSAAGNSEDLMSIQPLSNGFLAGGVFYNTNLFIRDYYYMKYDFGGANCKNYTVAVSTVTNAATTQTGGIISTSVSMLPTATTLTITQNFKDSVWCQSPVVTGIGNLKKHEGDLVIFPNPGNHLRIVSETDMNRIEIYNMLGQVVREEKDLNSRDIKLENLNFSKGLYTVRIYIGKESRVLKFQYEP